MDSSILFQEKQKLADTVERLVTAKSLLLKALERMGAGNLDRLKELRDDPEGGFDFYLLMEQLQEKNLAFNFKDKYKRLDELAFLLNEPYFSRIDLFDPKDTTQGVYYIGRFGYTEDIPIITDWRTRVASVYYRYRYPQKNVQYDTPAGQETKDLTLKRTFEIESAELIKYYNNDIQLDENEIITDKITKRTGGVLEDIVETIQLSQLDIIESDPRQVCIVQGCVGSGKSTVAIHKLAHIFFNHPNLIHPERSILVTKNQILIGYLSTLFPKLGIFDISYKTLRELLIHIIFREELGLSVDFDQNQDTSHFGVTQIKGLQEEIKRIHDHVARNVKAIYADPQFEAFASGKYSETTTPNENLSEFIHDIEEEMTMHREFIKENPKSVRTELYRENMKVMRRLLNKLVALRRDVKDKLLPNALSKYKIAKTQKLGYAQTLIYVYLYSQLVGSSKFALYEYCVVDEAQDFSLLEYLVLGKLIIKGRMALFGDLNQSLDVSGIGDWKHIPEVITEAKTANLFKLETNYRSTKPIIDLANSILMPFTTEYLPKSINRKGSEPVIKTFDTTEALWLELLAEISAETKNLNKSVGLIVNDDELYGKILLTVDKFKKNCEVMVLDSATRVKYIPKGLYIMRAEDCKGLEFAKVIVAGLNLTKVTTYEQAKKAFVMCTRAMNELHVFGLK